MKSFSLTPPKLQLQETSTEQKKALLKQTNSSLIWSLAMEYQASVLESKGWEIYRQYTHPLFTKFNSNHDGFIVEVDFTIDEDQYNDIDSKYGKMIYDRTYKTHAIKLPENVLTGPYPISKLAEYQVSSILGEEYTASGYKYPVDRNQAFDYNGIYELDEHKQIILSFLEGLDVKPTVIKLSDLPNPLEALATCTFKAIAIDNIDSEICVIMNSTYKGFDNMRENPCVIIPIKESAYNPRTITTFASQIFYRDNEKKNEQVKSIGAGWKIRNQTNHNYIEFLKQQAKSK